MSSQANDPVEDRLNWAVRIARQAGESTLRHFRRSDLVVESKADDSPVTIADRNAEELLRKRIAERFPDDGILGEEFGETDGSSGFRWVVDPIDGTKSFIHGVPLYTTLVAVLEGGEPRIGVIFAPACGEMVFAAAGKGCWYLDEHSAESTPQPAEVSRVGSLRESLVVTTEIRSYATGRNADDTDVFLQLQEAARLVRTWGDGYGYMLVATGRAEAMIDPIINLWDIAALQPIIAEAGGEFMDWEGRPTIHANDWIATNGRITEEVLKFTRRT